MHKDMNLYAVHLFVFKMFAFLFSDLLMSTNGVNWLDD